MKRDNINLPLMKNGKPRCFVNQVWIVSPFLNCDYNSSKISFAKLYFFNVRKSNTYIFRVNYGNSINKNRAKPLNFPFLCLADNRTKPDTRERAFTVSTLNYSLQIWNVSLAL